MAWACAAQRARPLDAVAGILRARGWRWPSAGPCCARPRLAARRLCLRDDATVATLCRALPPR
jgi:hypothetical protein